MSETKNINTNEVALPVKGEFKPKRAFISFISGTKSGLRFVSNTAFLPLKDLTGIFEEDVQIKFTICEEGTINIEEETNFCTKEMFQRFIDDIDERSVMGYTQKYVVKGLNFKSEDGKPCFLEVEQQRPIDKLSSLLDNLRTEREDQKLSSTGLSLLDSLFGESVEDETESTVEEEVEVEEEEEVNDSINEVEKDPSPLELAFKKMNDEKVLELQRRIDKNSEEVRRLKSEISSKEKLITEKSEEWGILKSRLRSLQPKPKPLGIYAFVGEENKTGITPDQSLVEVVKKISPLLKLKEEALIGILTKGYFTISLGGPTDFKIDREILDKVSSIDLNGKFSVVADHQIEYRGELTWHEILERLLQSGFEQDADFDKKSGSNSYENENKEQKENMIESTNFENYIFSVDVIDDEAWFAIQTKEHWDNEGCLDDQHQEIDLGNEWGEAMESTFSYEGDVLTGINDLLKKGVKFDSNFQSYMEQGSPFRINGLLLKDYILQNYPNSLV